MNKSRQHPLRISYYPVGIFCFLLIFMGCDWFEPCSKDPAEQVISLLFLNQDSSIVFGNSGVYQYKDIEIFNSSTNKAARYYTSQQGIIDLYYDGEENEELYSFILSDTLNPMSLGLTYRKGKICGASYRYLDAATFEGTILAATYPDFYYVILDLEL